MAEQAFTHRIVRIVVGITLIHLGIGILCVKNIPIYCRTVAHGRFGKFMTLWTISTSLLLPLYVVFEAWWLRKSTVSRKGLWIDAVLAITCFLVFCLTVLYSVAHYAMF